MKMPFVVLLYLWSSILVAQVSTEDALGNRITLAHPAKRIISLAPHTTELLFAAGADKQVIAVVNYSDYPPQAKELPQVGSYNRLDIERILSLKPDLVVAWKSGNPNEQVEYLREHGLPVFYSEPRSLESIPVEIIKLGKLLSTEKQAQKIADDFNRRLKKLRKEYSGKKKIRVFYQVWNQPLMTINNQHLISDVIRLCGGTNVFGSLPVLAPKINIEAVIQAAPDVIIAGTNKGRTTWLPAWNKWKVIPAVKHHQVYGINADLIVRHTPRILLGAEKMCEYIDKGRRVMTGGL